jgi:hypothetical protein
VKRNAAVIDSSMPRQERLLVPVLLFLVVSSVASIAIINKEIAFP